MNRGFAGLSHRGPQRRTKASHGTGQHRPTRSRVGRYKGNGKFNGKGARPHLRQAGTIWGGRYKTEANVNSKGAGREGRRYKGKG